MCQDEKSMSYIHRTLGKRLESFENWKGETCPSDMALAGFYFTGSEDICTCFHCGIEIKEWEFLDSPLDEHLSHSPNCGFALAMEKMSDNILKLAIGGLIDCDGDNEKIQTDGQTVKKSTNSNEKVKGRKKKVEGMKTSHLTKTDYIPFVIAFLTSLIVNCISNLFTNKLQST